MTGKDGKKRRRRTRGTPPPGRPPRHPGERLSKNRTFRVRGGLDERLPAAAAATGRSVSEEIEFRLDQSFDRDAFFGLVLGGDENAKVLQSIATVMKLESYKGHWLKDVETSDTVRRAVNFVIGQFAEPYQHPPLFPAATNPTMERAKVLPSNATPEALAYVALQTVRRNAALVGPRGGRPPFLDALSGRGRRDTWQRWRDKMKGHIRQRSPGRFAIVLETRDPATGKRRRKWHSFAGTKREAQIECARLISEINGGTYLEPTKTTLAQFFDQWLANVKGNVSPRTHERYEEIAKKNLIPLLGAITLTKLRPVQISAAYTKALADGRRDGKGGVSARTVHHMHRVMKQALAQAVRWQLLIRIPSRPSIRPR